MKNQIKCKQGEQINVWIKHRNTTERSLLSCDKIEYYDNHLMFYLKEDLIFKIWLKKDKYKDINEAIKDVDILVR
jgi:hypothetical protein